jgi:hypothetical protein
MGVVIICRCIEEYRHHNCEEERKNAEKINYTKMWKQKKQISDSAFGGGYSFCNFIWNQSGQGMGL